MRRLFELTALLLITACATVPPPPPPSDRQLLTAALTAFMSAAPQSAPPTLWLSNEDDSECDRADGTPRPGAGASPLDLLAFEAFSNQVVASRWASLIEGHRHNYTKAGLRHQRPVRGQPGRPRGRRDALCTNAAVAANKGGTWKAFLSSTTEDAISRIADVGPWYQELSNGSFVKTFNNKANLRTSPLTTLYLDEQGGGFSSSPGTYWSGTLQTGLKANETCASWTSSTSPQRGVRGTAGSWFNVGVVSCDSTESLVCFEQ